MGDRLTYWDIFWCVGLPVLAFFAGLVVAAALVDDCERFRIPFTDKTFERVEGDDD